MAKKKLVHFEENLTFPHLIQPPFDAVHSGFSLQSNWGKDFFHNTSPIIIELGCGKGEYTVGLGQRYPELNFIGIDVKGARLWRGARTVQDNAMKNVAFIRQRVDFVDRLFGKGEVSEIWITFPDPQHGKERKRLTSPLFLEKYRRILKKNGVVHLKTDDQRFFNYTKEVLDSHTCKILTETEDLYNSGAPDEVTSIQTYYESIWLKQEKKICYLKFMLV